MNGPYPKITYNAESDRFYYDWHGVIRPATEREIAGAMERLAAFEHEHDALLRGRIPTHRCKICGALWIFWPADAAGMTEASWSLFSLRCYNCCDCAPMGGQIEPLPRLGALSGEPASAHETSGDEQLRNAVEPILLGIGKIRVAICWSEDDPNKILRELVIYDDEGGYKPPGTDVLEHRGKKATEVGRILARLRVMSADGAEVFAADLRKVIEHTRSAEKAKEGQS